MLTLHSDSFITVARSIRNALIDAPRVNVGEWQAIRGDIPQASTVEVEDVSFTYILPGSLDQLRAEVHPSLPWADDHFAERVSGIPHNPPPSEAWWPYRQREGNTDHKQTEIFSHTYPERLWPKGISGFEPEGIRYRLGDLSDVVSLLQRSRHTRQAFIPIWYPEDTGAVENQRVPCTLGYHVMIRDGQLKIVYYIRSCDYLRHFRDDVYLAARLARWIADQLSPMTVVDRLVMHVSSMHVFQADVPRLISSKRLDT